MKCVEVNELIQRNLDSDLSDLEQNRLNQHIEICSECKSFYQRLRNVHLDLESLPRVTMPYSIVDSILPVLERIDPLVIEQYRESPHGPKKEIWSNRLFKNKWLPALTAVAAGVVMIVSASQLFKQEPMMNTSSELGRHTMQVSELSMNDVVLNEASQPSLMLSLTSNVEQTQVNINPEVAAIEPPSKAKTAEVDLLTIRGDDESQPVNDKPQITLGTAKDDENDQKKIMTPTFTSASSKQNMLTQESLEQSFVAFYTEEVIEIKRSNGEAVMEIKAEDKEQILNLIWISDTELQYSIQTETDTQWWIANIVSGVRKMKSEE